MCWDLLILFFLCRRIGVVAFAKERSSQKYQLLLIFLWFTGQLGAAFFVAILISIFYGLDESNGGSLQLIRIGAWGGAFIGAGIALALARRKVHDPENLNFDPCVKCKADLSSISQEVCPFCGTLNMHVPLSD